MPRLPAAGAGRKADRVIIIDITRKPRPVGEELHSTLSTRHSLPNGLWPDESHNFMNVPGAPEEIKLDKRPHPI